MGFWFLVVALIDGTPTTGLFYVPEHQACLQVAAEHLEMEQMKANVEVIYIGCPTGSAPGRKYR